MSDKDIEEVLAEYKVDGESKETNWTSLDLYYKGFHVKKSIPQNVDFETVIKSIERAIELGFEPSWNTETNKKQDPIMKATEGEGGVHRCPIHGDEMSKSKKGNWWHREEGGDRFCVGKGWIIPKDK